MIAKQPVDAAQASRERHDNPVDYFRSRGYLQDVTDESALRAAFDRGVVSAYVGLDPTAPSLHVGICSGS